MTSTFYIWWWWGLNINPITFGGDLAPTSQTFVVGAPAYDSQKKCRWNSIFRFSRWGITNRGSSAKFGGIYAQYTIH